MSMQIKVAEFTGKLRKVARILQNRIAKIISIMKKYPVVLTIAGSDCSGGAGIQADIKTISAAGCYAASAITAITAQNTTGVSAIYPLSEEAVDSQIRSVMDDLEPEAVKIGMVNDPRIVKVICSNLLKYKPKHVVYDPVMVSTSGHKLMVDSTINEICRDLIPLASIITPNLMEAEVLFGCRIKDMEDMKNAAMELFGRFGTAVLIKGGHLEGDDMTDVLYCDSGFSFFTDRKVESRNTHGTGCTLSSAIASRLALGDSMHDAVAYAKVYVHAAIVEAVDLGIGKGYGPLWHQIRISDKKDLRQGSDKDLG